MLSINDAAPDFSLPDQTGTVRSLKDAQGKWLILYFYPKDLTPGCTVEACSFRDNEARLTAKGAIVYGVSADGEKSHGRFAKVYSLSFPLLADIDKSVCTAYDVIGKKKFMGREFIGIKRMTFLINPEGKVAKIYETVKPAGHVDEILKDLEQLQSV